MKLSLTPEMVRIKILKEIILLRKWANIHIHQD